MKNRKKLIEALRKKKTICVNIQGNRKLSEELQLLAFEHKCVWIVHGNKVQHFPEPYLLFTSEAGSYNIVRAIKNFGHTEYIPETDKIIEGE